MSLADYTAQAIKNTAPKYLPGVINNTIRRRFLLSFLKKAGRFKYNEPGIQCTWNVTVREPEIRTTRGQRSQFAQSDTKEQLTIDHAQLEGTDMIDRNTMMVNRGPTQIVNLAETKMTELVDSLANKMNAQVYGDNSSDSAALTGLGSLFNVRVGANTDRNGVPDPASTYGGKSMALAALGGKWSASLGASRPNTYISTDWPEGNGDPQYDYLASKSYNYTGSWQSTNTWETNCERIIRRARVAIRALGGEGAAPALHLLAPDLYNTLQDAVQTRERLSPSEYAGRMGFPDVLSYEGALVAFDFDCPAGIGYAINPQEMALYSVHDQLFYTDGPTWDTREQAYLFLVGFLGNLRWNPKHFAQYGSYTV